MTVITRLVAPDYMLAGTDINKDRLALFLNAYAEQLHKAAIAEPAVYRDRDGNPHTERSIQLLAERMTFGLFKGTACKDGRAISATCRVLKIKHTYKAIHAFLRGEP